MSARSRRVLATAVAAGALLGLPAPGAGEGAASTTTLPELGAGDSQMVLMGAPAGGAPGDAWGYRSLPLDVGPPEFEGHRLAFGPVADARSPTPQLAFERHVAGQGWLIAETPVDEDGHPYRGPAPNRLSPRITARGGGVLVGRDTTRPAARQDVALVRDPAGPFRAAPRPPASVLLPGESLASDRGAGTVADAAVDGASGTVVFLAPKGLDSEPAVLRYEGGTWTREPVDAPAASTASFQVLAIDATSEDNAWLLARSDSSLGEGLQLYERQGDGAKVHWARRPLGDAVWDHADDAAQGTSGVQALGGAAQPITVTADGVWIDAGFELGGDSRTATLFYDRSQARLTSSWCDASLCAHPLHASLSSQQGYRSFAWSGPGFGTRVITNPLASGGGEDTNRGTYLDLQGDAWVRRPGGGGNFRPSGAFASATDGWLEGPAQVGKLSTPHHLEQTSVAVRSPLTAVTPEPGSTSGALGAQALAVGDDGAVARYHPGKGWVPEFLLTESGAVTHPTLRGVAWPEENRAHAVGDVGAMWLWRAETGLWERDPAAPINFEANLEGVAFDPSDPGRGYAVGKAGTLLRYDKTWTQEDLPSGFSDANLSAVTFAGSEALVAAGTDVLVNRGGAWTVDAQLHDLLSSAPTADRQILSVAGLPDGGAVAAGRDIVAERDGAGQPWRLSRQPLPGSTVVAVAAVRAGGEVRAVVSVQPQIRYPAPDYVPPPDPNVPPPVLPPFPLPADGYVLRETATGWSDEQRTAFAGSGLDRPVKSDPIAGFALGAGGTGWAVGGWSGESDSAGRGSSARNATGSRTRARVHTAGIYRYSPSGPAPVPEDAHPSAVPLPAGPVRFAVGGHAMCATACADLENQGLAPDRTLTATLATAAGLARRPGGPRAFLYTGGRLPASGDVPETPREAERFAGVLGAEPSLPTFAAASAADTANGGGPYRDAFGPYSAPFGTAAPAGGIAPVDDPGGTAPGPGARTHYAFDTAGDGGTVRVVVIDNSSGSLAASDPHQNPAEPQAPWLTAVLADARRRSIPSIVVGSRELNARFRPRLNVASDADLEAGLLVDGGASAYFYERPEENRAARIPSGARETIPEFGTGTLGYRSPVGNTSGSDNPDALFGSTGFLIAEVNAARRDAATNRAPVNVRLIPTVSDVSLDAIDGTLLRRSRVALFQGLGRRPPSGDRWGRLSADGSPDPPGADPYTAFPTEQCQQAGCSTRIAPEYTFTSADPDFGDFVATDPKSTNLRKPLLDAKNKTTTDHSSGLFCAFNPGTTTVTISAGGLSFSQRVTILSGSVQQPCGTRPLSPGRFPAPNPAVSPPPPPPASPAAQPSPPPPLPPPPAPAVVHPAPPPPPVVAMAPHVRPPVHPAAHPRALEPLPPFLPVPRNGLSRGLPGSTAPGNPAAGRPIPPGGAVARVYQVDREEEEEAAPEQSQAFSAYHPAEHEPPPAFVFGFVVLAAAAGATIRRSRRGGGRGRPNSMRAAPARAHVVQPTRRRSP